MIRIIKISVISILLLQATIFAQAQDSAKEYFITGKTADLTGNYTASAENYLLALKYSNSPGIHFALSQAYTKLNKFKEAMVEINKALAQDDSNPEFLMHKAEIYLDLGQKDEAIKVYSSLLEKDTDDYSVIYSLARLYEGNNQPEQAAVLYEKITDEYGFDYEVLRRLYDIYANKNRYTDCERVLEYILKMDPYDTQNRIRLASLYEYNSKYDESLKIYEELQRLNPSDKKIQNSLVKLYFLTDRPDKGFKEFAAVLEKDTLSYDEKIQMGEMFMSMISQEKSAVKISMTAFGKIRDEYPDAWKPYFYLGMTKIAAGSDDFVDDFENALQRADTSRDAYTQIGYTYFEKSLTERAYLTAYKGVTMYPDDFKLNYILGLTLQRQGKLDDAAVYLEKALTINPDDISLLSTLGLMYNTMKKYDKSNKMYERALAIDPDNVLVLNNYAYNLSGRGENLSAALAMSKKVIQKEPENANYLDTMGWIYFKLKDYLQAKYFTQKSLDLNASSSVVQEHMGDILSALNDVEGAAIHYQKAYELNQTNNSAKEKLENLKK